MKKDDKLVVFVSRLIFGLAVGCITAIGIAFTIKIVMWLL